MSRVRIVPKGEWKTAEDNTYFMIESPFNTRGTVEEYLASVQQYAYGEVATPTPPTPITLESKLLKMGMVLPEREVIYPGGRREWLIQTSPDTYQEGKDTALIVIAHPDDEAFVGGLIHKLRHAGKQVFVVSVSDGGASTTHSPDVIVNQRREEMRNAMQRLDVNLYINLGFPDGEVQNYHSDVVQQLVQYMRIFDPAVVIGHGRQDYHYDHRGSQYSLAVAYESLYKAQNANHEIPGIPITHSSPVYYEMDHQGSQTRNGRRTDVDYVVRLNSADVKAKMASFAAHESQVNGKPGSRLTSHIEQQLIDTRQRGRNAGTIWGEGLFDMSFGGEAFDQRNILAEWLGKDEIISLPPSPLRRKLMEIQGTIAGLGQRRHLTR